MLIDASVLPGFIAVILLFLAPPGPDMAFMIAVGLGHGRRAAIAAILGLATGMSVYAAAMVVGVGELARAYPLALDALKIAGAFYLLWLGFASLRGARHHVSERTVVPAGRIYRRGVLVSVTNPKVLLFFLAVLPQFVGQARDPTLQLALLGAINVLSELVVYGAVGLLAGTLHARFRGSTTAAAAMQYLSGAVFLLLAVVVLAQAVSAIAAR